MTKFEIEPVVEQIERFVIRCANCGREQNFATRDEAVQWADSMGWGERCDVCERIKSIKAVRRAWARKHKDLFTAKVIRFSLDHDWNPGSCRSLRLKTRDGRFLSIDAGPGCYLYIEEVPWP